MLIDDKGSLSEDDRALLVVPSTWSPRAQVGPVAMPVTDKG